MIPGWRISLALLAVLLMAGCAPSAKTRNFGVLDPLKEREVLYVVPFDATLVPVDFGNPIFDEFVDILNSRRKQTKVGRFVILKEELKEVEPAWLIKQIYVSGDIWGYVENSGCCSTEMRVKSRIYLYEPGKSSPTLEVFIPVEHFFEHDRSTVPAAKARLGKKLAQDLADAIIKNLTP